MSVNDDAVALKGGKGPWQIRIKRIMGLTAILLLKIVYMVFAIVR